MASKGFSATSVKSVREAQERLRKYLRTIETVPYDELSKEAVKLEREAKAETPYKSGKLEDSVRATVSKSQKGATLLLRASARSKGYNYAGIQHENTSFNHPIKGKAHYLRDPYNRAVKRLKARLKKRMKFKGGK